MASRLQIQARRRASVWAHQEADITTIEHKVSFGSNAPFCHSVSYFRFTPNNGHCHTGPACLKGAMNRQCR
jgi:hypothetical protein